MNTKISIFALTSLIVLSACSSTPERRPQPDKQARGPAQSSGVFVKPIGLLFAAMDEDQNRLLSGEELVSGIETEWSYFGSNPSAAYFTEWSKKTLGSTDAFPTFMSFDADLNGVVTKLEFSDRLRMEFSSLDKNNDGSVSRDEMLITFEAPRARQRGGSEQSGRGGRGGGGERGGGRPPR